MKITAPQGLVLWGASNGNDWQRPTILFNKTTQQHVGMANCRKSTVYALLRAKLVALTVQQMGGVCDEYRIDVTPKGREVLASQYGR